MGGSSYNRDHYDDRASLRASTAKSKGISDTAATFAHDHAIKTGAAKAEVHPSLSPKGVKIRESRDSADHPVTVPIIVGLDTTGSMAHVPITIQKNLSRLMGCFLEAKASGKQYLGDGYPAIMIGAVDDYNAMGRGGDGTLQAGQFESGLEIDDNLTNLWLTGQGGGTYHEQYDALMYFAARHTAHDHFEKRGMKGYLFMIGDEHPYDPCPKEMIKAVIGDSVQADIPLAVLLAELKERYHVFFIIPNMTSYYDDPKLEQAWVKLLGQQNVLKLEEPDKICEMIVSAVAICEEHVNMADLVADSVVAGAMSTALAPLAKNAGGGVTKYSAAGLPATTAAGGADRL